MTWVRTFGLIAACGKSPLSALSTFNDATGGARLRFSTSLSPCVVVAGGDVVVVVVVLVDLVVVPAVDDAIDEMLTVTAEVDDVMAVDEADVTDEALDVATDAPADTLDNVSIIFVDDFTFDATEFVCDKLDDVALIKSVEQYISNDINL